MKNPEIQSQILSQLIQINDESARQIENAWRQLIEYEMSDQSDAGSSNIEEWQLFCFESASSTMDLASLYGVDEPDAKSALERGRIIGTVGEFCAPAIFLVLEQTKGRGREQRVWESKKKEGLYLTFYCRPDIEPTKLIGCSLSAGVAIREFYSQLGIRAGLKWPNDVLTLDKVDGIRRKLAGILVELSSSGSEAKSLLLGIGANLNQERFPEGVPGISPRMINGKEIDFALASARLSVGIVRFLERYFMDGFAAFIDSYRSASLMLGAQIFYSSPGGEKMLGTVRRVCEDGGLELTSKNSEGAYQIVYSGEVELLE